MSAENGSLTVIVGPMFSGKSAELLRRLGRLKFAKREYLLFKPDRDTRTLAHARSRDGTALEAIVFESFEKLLQKVREKTEKSPVRPVIGIDEVQFTAPDKMIEVIMTLMRDGHEVHVAGLDLTFKGEPFPTVATLLSMAHRVVKLNAYCSVCGASAQYSQLLDTTGVEGSIKVGDIEYAARCLRHFTPPT